MATRSPGIACIGVIGRKNNPLHISLFPAGQRDVLEFQFLLSSSLDIFEARQHQVTADHDFGLLQALDERIAMYGWLTNTGVKLVIVVDMEGRPSVTDNKNNTIIGIRNSDLRPAFRALQTAYINLLRNPFYDPEGYSPHRNHKAVSDGLPQITSISFIKEVKRIGESWYPGIAAL